MESYDKDAGYIMSKFYIIMLIIIIVIILLFMPVACNGDKEDIVNRDGAIQTGGHVDYTNPDAPKTIESKTINSFEYTFFIHASNYERTADYDPEREILYNNCSFSLVREEEGARCIGSGYSQFGDDAFDFEFLTALSTLDDLHTIIDREQMARSNGIYKRTIGIPDGLGAKLKVEYDSGESISAYDNSGSVIMKDANLALYNFFMDLAKEEKAI